jgi:hypothetical protein
VPYLIEDQHRIVIDEQNVRHRLKFDSNCLQVSEIEAFKPYRGRIRMRRQQFGSFVGQSLTGSWS